MGASLFFARFLGLYLVIIGVGFIFNRKNIQKIMDDFFKSPALIYLGAVMALLFGLVLVLFHNVWVADWRVIITIFGWMGLIKGATLVGFPNSMAKLLDFYRGKTLPWIIHMGLIIALGAFLTIRGFSA